MEHCQLLRDGEANHYFACRHHVIELRAKEIEKVIGKVTNGPIGNTFTILHNNWDKIFS